ncbi:saccharopine dehydrogenase NADP-binding domain-containing protein [Fulvivirgaceae bacterium BMA10]|uniref:Saccharopine dehydrogenase NADP-binding domain-containing protein n=1 Tax=Splendidivirga corallicola TaxID=3051826 RepID=A0ABT8KGJ1_9BACT|nr:saccharopine dehydrogenase NADP-binding domain-containing protein [Fulvivirgaceae bacterium BMA10]
MKLPTDTSDILIYGSYGYTGTLIAEQAVEKGLYPLLAGRNESKTAFLANRLNLPYIAFDLDNSQTLHEVLDRVKLVLNCAGPFSETAKPMVEACIAKGVHYLDITGEIEVFEYIASKNNEAKEAKIMLMPGVGFDVVPTDCLASYLKQQLPDANELELAFKGANKISRGTALTMVKNIHKGGAIRSNGQIIPVPAGFKTKLIDFGKGERSTVSIPWGDVSTAYHSTNIPNIIVYTFTNKGTIRFLKLSNKIKWLLGSRWVQNFLRNRINKKLTGPDTQTRNTSFSYIWGQVKNLEGKKRTALLKTAEGYRLTAEAAVLAMEKVLAGNIFPGFKTPSIGFGYDFVMELQDTERRLLD